MGEGKVGGQGFFIETGGAAELLRGERELVTEAMFTYVAIDAQGNPRPVPKENNPKLAGLL